MSKKHSGDWVVRHKICMAFEPELPREIGGILVSNIIWAIMSYDPQQPYVVLDIPANFSDYEPEEQLIMDGFWMLFNLADLLRD